MATKKAALKNSAATKSSATKAPVKTAAAAKKQPAKKSAKSSDNYTKPELREKVKAEVMAGDKGGRPGQWSARKAQLVAHEYEAEGAATSMLAAPRRNH